MNMNIIIIIIIHRGILKWCKEDIIWNKLFSHPHQEKCHMLLSKCLFHAHYLRYYIQVFPGTRKEKGRILPSRASISKRDKSRSPMRKLQPLWGIKGKAEIPFSWEGIFLKEMAKEVTWQEEGSTAGVGRDQWPLHKGVSVRTWTGLGLGWVPRTRDIRKQQTHALLWQWWEELKLLYIHGRLRPDGIRSLCKFWSHLVDNKSRDFN